MSCKQTKISLLVMTLLSQPLFAHMEEAASIPRRQVGPVDFIRNHRKVILASALIGTTTAVCVWLYATQLSSATPPKKSSRKNSNAPSSPLVGSQIQVVPQTQVRTQAVSNLVKPLSKPSDLPRPAQAEHTTPQELKKTKEQERGLTTEALNEEEASFEKFAKFTPADEINAAKFNKMATKFIPIFPAEDPRFLTVFTPIRIKALTKEQRELFLPTQIVAFCSSPEHSSAFGEHEFNEMVGPLKISEFKAGSSQDQYAASELRKVITPERIPNLTKEQTEALGTKDAHQILNFMESQEHYEGFSQDAQNLMLGNILKGKVKNFPNESLANIVIGIGIDSLTEENIKAFTPEHIQLIYDAYSNNSIADRSDSTIQHDVSKLLNKFLSLTTQLSEKQNQVLKALQAKE